MPASPIFVCDDASVERRVRRLQTQLPRLAGQPVRLHKEVGLRDGRVAVHAGSFLRERRIAFNCPHCEFPRIFVHEVFHFVWLRLGNRTRLDFESLLYAEARAGARGELGWSAEWRKAELGPRDRQQRTRRWREYCCEAFCDTAAWRFASIGRHEEFTLAARHRELRRRWFAESVETRVLSI